MFCVCVVWQFSESVEDVAVMFNWGCLFDVAGCVVVGLYFLLVFLCWCIEGFPVVSDPRIMKEGAVVGEGRCERYHVMP